MAYKLIVTEHTEKLLDNLVFYLLFRLDDQQAASHLFDSLEKIYVRLEENPYQFPQSRDSYLKRQGYREAVLVDMDYVVIFRVTDDTVYIVGIFHQLEDYRTKIARYL